MMRSILPFALAACAALTPAAALAGANKTWVSGTGTDSGSCPITAPCKSFQYALGQTSAGGEIDVKDAGGYGIVTITKAITIVAAPGVLATISVPSSGTGITVTAGVNDVVILRGLTIDGHGVGQYGIMATKGRQILVRDSTVQGMTGTGIAFYSPGQATLGRLTVSSTVIQNNTYGIQKTGANGYDTRAHFENDRFTGNQTGLQLSGGYSNVANCTFEDNTVNGVDNVNEFAFISHSNFSTDASENFDSGTYSPGDNVFVGQSYQGNLNMLQTH